MYALSEEQLTAIDLLAGRSGPAYSSILISELGKTLVPTDDLVKLGAVGYAAERDANARKAWDRSRLCDDARGRKIEVLSALATALLGRALTLADRPYWKDQDYLNEVLTNVAVTGTRAEKPAKKVSKYGVPPSSPEYWRRYNADPVNKAKQKEHQKRYQEKKKALMVEAKERLGLGPNATLKDLERRLSEQKTSVEQLAEKVSAEVILPESLSALLENEGGEDEDKSK